MKSKHLILVLSISLFFGFSNQKTECLIETSLGTIVVELYPDKAPKTVANFLQYVTQDLYNDSSFFRVCTTENESERTIKIEVIQGGNVPEDELLAPIVIETTAQTNIKHQNGTLSMARSTPNSAQSSFFICINDQPELDFNGKRNPDGQGFAAFGKVVNGMDIVTKIQALENSKQALVHPVRIITIKIIN